MVFAVQCPSPKCKKFMLVEDHLRNQIVACLVCKTPIRAGGGAPQQPRGDRPPQK
jgi:hypothetical protein